MNDATDLVLFSLLFAAESGFSDEGLSSNQIIDGYWELVDKGSSLAAVRLGSIYERGDGVRKDPAKAVELYSLASKLGNVEGKFHLAVYFYNEEIFDRCIPLLFECAKVGFAPAFTILGACFEKGFGNVSKSTEDAFKLYQVAALKNNNIGRIKLAKCFETGIGTIKNTEKMKMLLEWGCNSGDANACYELAMTIDKNSPTEAEQLLQRARKLGRKDGTNQRCPGP